MAPRLLQARARTLEQLKRTDDALVIARDMRIMLKPKNELTRRLQAEYAAMATRLSPSLEARTPTMVPSKR